jgi:hypothetical protein
MSQSYASKTGPVLFLGAALFLGAGRADESVIPANLTESQKANLKKALAAEEKPKQFIPDKAKFVGTPPEGLDRAPTPGVEIKQYLAAIVPYTTTDPKKTPEKAYVYWYRPNPKQGSPGVTVRRVVDLNTGQMLGEPEVLFNHATPVAAEERTEAIRLAREKIPAVRDLYAGADEKDIAIDALVQVISTTGLPEGAPGDRVVSLQFRKKDTTRRTTVMVNLTQQTACDANAP